LVAIGSVLGFPPTGGSQEVALAGIGGGQQRTRHRQQRQRVWLAECAADLDEQIGFVVGGWMSNGPPGDAPGGGSVLRGPRMEP
jgi:hypothetical protein